MTQYRGLAQPEEVKVCVLYDPSTGDVVHTHQVSTLPGGRRLDEPALEQRIRDLAKRHGADSPHLRVLHVDPKEVVFGARYAVDVEGQKLVRVAGVGLRQR